MKRRYAWLVWAVGGVGLALLIVDHWAHAFGLLPYVVLLACPLMHLFMHRGHGHGGHRNDAAREPEPPKAH